MKGRKGMTGNATASTPNTGKMMADPAPTTVYSGAGSNVVKEAKKRKRGGRVKREDGGKVEGGVARMKLDRPGRQRGGRIGADTAPLSSAARASPPVGHKEEGA